MYALNFYRPWSPTSCASYEDRDDPAGDKSAKHKKGMVVQVLVGNATRRAKKVFDAVIDKVEVKQLGELSPREIEHDNPEIRCSRRWPSSSGRLYNREVTEEDTVTVIRFSAILPKPAE